ncbi:MAG: FAD-dependent oxidoreductase [Actinomycetota bacterium]
MTLRPASRHTTVVVVGAGVSGLTCATLLAEAGFTTRIVAAEAPDSTTSMVAAAVWTASGHSPESRHFAWSLRTRKVFADLAADPSDGVIPLIQYELEVDHLPPHGWEVDYEWIRSLGDDELPAGYGGGWRIDGFRIDPTIYLPWLLDRFHAAGGNATWQRLARLEEVDADVVVNCTGLGARELCDDRELVPIRGQVVAVKLAGIAEGISDEHDLDRIRYVYPRTDEVILGGTREVGGASLQPDPMTTARIMADCRQLVPALADAEFIEARVGLRPGRPTVRLETSRLGDRRPVVHNYGHGGQGYLLSWGCAAEVVDQVTALGGDSYDP